MITDSDARKDLPIHTGFNNYFPLAIAEVARLSMVSNEKHNPGEPLHWSKDKSNDHSDCLARHQLEWDKMDTDNFYHAVKVAWRAMAQLEILLENPPVTYTYKPGEMAPLDWSKNWT